MIIPRRYNIVYQLNKSNIILENNGKKSSSKQTHALIIHYFFLKDQIEKESFFHSLLPHSRNYWLRVIWEE